MGFTGQLRRGWGMIELVIVSGKGGTGKTSIVGSISALAERKIMVDCDVDAADLHLILNNELKQSHDFIASSKAEIIEDKCTDCGICQSYCRFEAIRERAGHFRVDQYSCEGCGVCTRFCPEEAIDFKRVVSGQWFLSDTRYGPLVHARLGIAQSNSGRLVSHLRKLAKDLAEENRYDLVIVDGPPGIGCPVIASITGADYLLIVTEPSLSALHDMERLFELARHFQIPVGICINKYDINPEISARVEKYALGNGAMIMGRISFDPKVTEAQVAGMTFVEFADNGTAEEIKSLWQNLKNELAGVKNHKPDFNIIR
jgi:MinD superfamily P-loop ATPase